MLGDGSNLVSALRKNNKASKVSHLINDKHDVAKS